MNDNSIVLCDVKKNIAVVTFNRPDVLNALNASLLGEFARVLDRVAADESIRVLILTGAGEKAFVAGADIKELAQCDALTGKHFSVEGHKTIDRLQSLPIPVIAAVNGYALGGGSEIALACDFIYASETAMFGLPEISLGLIPGFGGTQRLPRLIGMNRAKELIFSGRMISATEAEGMGLVNRICSPETLMEETLKTAAGISAKGKVSLREAKQVINAGINMDLADGCRLEINAFSLCMASIDAKEGTRAFIEKRKADFQGSQTT